MMSTSSGVALYTVDTPENVVPKSTAITILSSVAFSLGMVVERGRVVLVIVGILLLGTLVWFMVILRRYLEELQSRSSGAVRRMVAQPSVQRPILAQTTKQQNKPLLMWQPR